MNHEKSMMEHPNHPLFGADLKIKRASDQLKTLDASIRAFFDSNPYTLELQADPKTEILWNVVRVGRLADPVWSAMTGEIIHNLRCALDYLVFQLVLLNTGADPKGKKNQFPIFLRQQGFDSRGVPQNLQGVGPKAVALIKSLQPFATGEDLRSPLWHLQEFSNWDKHRSIHLTGASMPNVNAGMTIGSVGGSMVAVAPPGLIKDNALLFGRSIHPGPEPLLERASKVDVKGQATFHITFEKPLVDLNLKAQTILDVMGRRVLEIAKRVESEFF
jgi:hypothetical protein